MNASKLIEKLDQPSWPTTNIDIYVSCSKKDHDLFKNIILPILVDIQKESGYTYWFDETNLRAINDKKCEIERLIENSCVFLTFQSKNSLKTDEQEQEKHLKWERRMAREKHDKNSHSRSNDYFILPVAEGAQDEILPSFCSDIQHLDIHEKTFAAHLKENIKKIVNNKKKNEYEEQYIGLSSYTEANAHHFWGRDYDIERIAAFIQNNITTFLFGASGCGKTSLLRAGITPTLKRDNYHSIYITPRTASNEIDKTNLWKLITSKIDKMVERLLLTPVPKHNDVEWSKAKLWEKLYLFDYKDEYETDHHFLIIIDQFEEIFQINNSLKDIRDLFTGYELLCGYYKDSIIIQNINHKDYLTGEYFVKYKYKNINISHRLVLSLRRDFMYEMESHSDDFPILSKNRICLNPLNEEQAAEIITSSKSPDGKKWFSMEEAKSIIRDLSGRSDFEFDGIPEIEIDAMILSLYMKETCDSKLKLQDNTISKEYIDASSVIQSYYSRHMTHPGVENLESLLVTLDGFRKPITKSEAENYIPEDILNKYVELGILKTYVHRNIKWVELSHDKLCSCAAHRISVAKAKNLNRKIISPYLYLLPQGRLQFSNSFYEDFRRDSRKSLTFAKWLSYIQRRGIINPQIDMNLSGLYLNSDAANDCTLSLKLNNSSAGACYTDDGIEEIIVKLAKDKLYSISYRRDNKAYAIYDGVHKIEFYYDADGRLILLDFFDINNDRLWNDKGFTSILFEYKTSSEMPSHTYYLDIPQGNITEIANPKDESFVTKLKQFKTKHLEGNYGYASTYNEYDLEISRIFLDESDNEITLSRGFSELRFEVYQTGAILSYSYFCRSEKVEIDGVHKVKLIYANDKFSEPPTQEFYYDINNLPAKSNDGTYGTEFCLKQHCICTTNLNKEGKPCADNRGITHQLIYLNKHKQFECCFSFDLKNNLSNSENIKASLKEIVYFINYPDSKIRQEIALDNNLNISKITSCSYNNMKRLCRHISYNAQQRITDYFDIQHNKHSECYTSRTPQGEPINSFKRVLISDTLSIYISSDGSKEANETDANGNIIRTYKCDNFNNQIHDNDGSWETRYEYEFVKSENTEMKTKELYYSQNGEPFEIQPGVYGYAWKYELPTNSIEPNVKDCGVLTSSLTPVKREYEVNSRGEPILHCVKYCYKNNIIDNYAFFDESHPVVTRSSKDGVHACITHKINDENYVIRHYNTRGELCNCSDGWATWLLESNGARRIFFDAHNKPVNGPCGWHLRNEISISFPEDNTLPYSSHEYLDVDNNLIDDDDGAQSKIEKLSLYDKLSLIIKNELSFKYLFDVIFSQKVINANRVLLKSAFIIYKKKLSRLIYQPRIHSSQSSSSNPIYTLHALEFSTDIKEMKCIIIDQALNNPMATCIERDVIIQFGEWHIFDYIDEFSINYKTPISSYLMIEDFERTFNTYHENRKVFTLMFARLSENNQWQIYSVEIAMTKDLPNIGKFVDKKISKIAYSEIFSTYKMKINGPTKINDDIDLVDIVKRVKELLQNASKMLPGNNEITPE